MKGRIAALVAAILLVGASIALVLNVAGRLPIPVGPLGVQDGVSGASVTAPHDPVASPLYFVPFVVNHGPLAVRIDAVIPVGVTVPGSVEVVGSLPFDRSSAGEQASDGTDTITGFIAPETPDAWHRPEAATGAEVAPVPDGVSAGRAFLVRISPDPAHETRVDHVDVAYSIGPFRFITTARTGAGSAITLCGPDRPTLEAGCGGSD